MQTGNIDLKQYLFIVKRRWLLAASVFLLILGGGITYCFVWPKSYEATALIVVQPQKVPSKIVAPTVTSKIEDRLQIITQHVLSRTRLTEIINRFNLYSKRKDKATPDELAEAMRRDVIIKLTRKNYFTISFRYYDPKDVAAVANALAAFYVDSNLRLREQDAVGTARFLAREQDRMRGNLREWENRITKFKESHLHELPSAQEKNLLVLDTIERRLMFITHNIQTEQLRINQQEGELAKLTAEIQKLEMRRDHLRKIGAQAGTGGSQQGDTEPEAIKAEIERLKVFYTEDHPDIQRMERHLKRALALKKAKEKNKKKKKVVEDNSQTDELDMEMGSLQESRRRVAERVAASKERMAEHYREQAAAQAEMRKIRKYIENGPAVAEKLEDLTRGYDVLKKAYEELHSKWLEAKMSADLERTQRGEQFEVVDPAQVPDAPFRPDIRKALPLTLMAALFAGVGLAFGLNYLDTSFVSVDQMEKLSEFPVLVVVPRLSTAEEASQSRRTTTILGSIYTAIFLVMLFLVAILLTGRAPALKKMVMGLIS